MEQAMNEPNNCLSHLPWHGYSEDELAHMFQTLQDEPPAEMQQLLPPFAEQEQQYFYYSTSPPPVAPNNPPPPFHPPHPAGGDGASGSTNFHSSGSPALPVLPYGAAAVKNEPGQPPSSSSRIFFFGDQPPGTLNFSAGDWPDGTEGAHVAWERRSSQEHIVAERRRREKMQRHFVALAAIVPDLRKTDKLSILGSTIEYVKHLEEKVKTLQEQITRRTSEPRIFRTNCSISTDDRIIGPSGSPTVEASIREDTVLLKICCKARRGLVVMILSELENLGLSMINTCVLPFTDSFRDITITAKIGGEFSTAAELGTKLTTILRDFRAYNYFKC